MDARVKPAHDKRATLGTGPDSLSLMHGSAKVGMIRLTVAIFIFISNLSFAANAQERVIIGTQRLTENGALFMAAAQGYFKAEGIELAMTAYDSDQAVSETLASSATDFGLARFTPARV
jgi:ABC-type nitrate/sulfonate/bicarbonate transport system substrate-binding protein